MSEFYKAIMENPTDDGIRLIYADYLEEQEDLDRAEFIRVQVELAKYSNWSGKLATLVTRHKELINKHVEWRKELYEALPYYNINYKFHRGFIGYASIDGNTNRILSVLDRFPIQAISIDTFPTVSKLIRFGRWEWIIEVSIRVAIVDIEEFLYLLPLFKNKRAISIPPCKIPINDFNTMLYKLKEANVQEIHIPSEFGEMEEEFRDIAILEGFTVLHREWYPFSEVDFQMT